MNRLIICLCLSPRYLNWFSAGQVRTKDQKDKASYSIGLELGNSLKKGKMDVNADKLLKGLKDGISGAKPLLTEEQVKETMTALQKEMTEKQAAAKKESGEKNAADGEKFLGGKQKERRRENDRQRVAIQSLEGRSRRIAEGDRYRRGQLSSMAGSDAASTSGPRTDRS